MKPILTAVFILLNVYGFSQCVTLTPNDNGIVIYCAQEFNNDRAEIQCTESAVVLEADVNALMTLKETFKVLGLSSISEQFDSGFKMRCEADCRKIFFETPNKIRVRSGQGSQALRSVLKLDKFYKSEDIEYELGMTLKVEPSRLKNGSANTHIEIIFTIRKRDTRDPNTSNWADFEPVANMEDLKTETIKIYGDSMGRIHKLFSGYYCSK